MPTRESVASFIADVLSNDHVGAIERWYHADASMQENGAPPRVGRDVLMAGESAVLAKVRGVVSELVAPPVIDGDQVAIRWRFTFERADGAKMTMEEVAWQTWRGERIFRETFFYDPAQRVFVMPA